MKNSMNTGLAKKHFKSPENREKALCEILF